MKKCGLTDGTGRWFDEDAAKMFRSVSYMHETAEVCRATGSTSLWETLYLTSYGTFVLVCTCDGIDRVESEGALEIDVKSAVQWLITNGHQEEVRKLDLASEEGQLEI